MGKYINLPARRRDARFPGEGTHVLHLRSLLILLASSFFFLSPLRLSDPFSSSLSSTKYGTSEERVWGLPSF